MWKILDNNREALLVRYAREDRERPESGRLWINTRMKETLDGYIFISRCFLSFSFRLCRRRLSSLSHYRNGTAVSDILTRTVLNHASFFSCLWGYLLRTYANEYLHAYSTEILPGLISLLRRFAHRFGK